PAILLQIRIQSLESHENPPRDAPVSPVPPESHCVPGRPGAGAGGPARRPAGPLAPPVSGSRGGPNGLPFNGPDGPPPAGAAVPLARQAPEFAFIDGHEPDPVARREKAWRRGRRVEQHRRRPAEDRKSTRLN